MPLNGLSFAMGCQYDPRICCQVMYARNERLRDQTVTNFRNEYAYDELQLFIIK